MHALDTTSSDISTPKPQESFGTVLNAQEKFEEKRTKDHQKNSFENIERLHNMLDQNSASDSLASMEGLASAENPQDKKQNGTISFLRNHFPRFALAFASGMHIFAAFTKATKILPKTIEDFFNKRSLHASKIANLINYTMEGAIALGKGRSWDGIGRLAYWIAPYAGLENFFLFSGISSGITMMEQGHLDKVKPSKNIIEDFKNNCTAFVEKIKEIYKHGIGKNRIFFRFDRAIEEKYKGTMFVSAFGNFFGAALGLFSPEKNSLLRKFAAVIRNLGGIGCDWGKFLHPDRDNQISAAAYGIVSTLDVMQTFTPEPFATILSHFSLATNNLANYFYVNTSKKRSNGDYKIQNNQNLATAA